MKQYLNTKTVTIGLTFLFVLSILYTFFVPEYIFTHYKLPDCKTELTKIEFTGFRYDKKIKFDRELFFVYGFYEENEIPQNAYELSNFSGFDSIFEMNVTCSNDTIILNHIYGLKQVGNPKKLIARQLENIEYIKLREKGGLLIVSE
ncbi:hypothetical protein VB796_11160 [Arcicella sp. LKC2W]|uniref:hypothetical protein n=1 Tax=Arcicella sp. LKC2W TaxID=2984198 RepID=UPI002B1EF8F5|nr:hypothetical protein [Arcicella sp. LKC2W]MEA5459604.1 hypothetical protein [Arcicella sp. LKC2W]